MPDFSYSSQRVIHNWAISENVITILSSCTGIPELHYLYDQKRKRKKKSCYLWKPQSSAAFNGATVPESLTLRDFCRTPKTLAKMIADAEGWLKHVTVSVLLFYSDFVDYPCFFVSLFLEYPWHSKVQTDNVTPSVLLTWRFRLCCVMLLVMNRNATCTQRT